MKYRGGESYLYFVAKPLQWQDSGHSTTSDLHVYPMSNQKSSRRPLSDALEPIAATLASSSNTLSIVKEALLTPFHGESRRAEGLSKLNDRTSAAISCFAPPGSLN